jgi:hypothetical protein
MQAASTRQLVLAVVVDQAQVEATMQARVARLSAQAARRLLTGSQQETKGAGSQISQSHNKERPTVV